jgi:hypothetical protein
MSFAPQTLLDARAYLQPHTGLSWVALGIVGSTGHTFGYHLGRDRLSADDYSARVTRDLAGLTDAAAALDVGSFPRLRELTAYMAAEARAGRLPDVRELIGPGSDGRAYRWDHLAGWSPVRRAAGDSHEWHLHISYYRDSEHRSKVAPFRAFFEPEPEEDELSWTEKLNLPDWITKATGDKDGVASAGGLLVSAYGHSWSANHRTSTILSEQRAGQAAILAAVAGDDVGAAVRAELDTHRAALLAELGEVLVPAVLAGLREQLGEVADERLVAAAEAGVRAALGGLDEAKA